MKYGGLPVSHLNLVYYSEAAVCSSTGIPFIYTVYLYIGFTQLLTITLSTDLDPGLVGLGLTYALTVSDLFMYAIQINTSLETAVRLTYIHC